MKLLPLLEEFGKENPEHIQSGKYNKIYKAYFKLLLNHEYESTCCITTLDDTGMATGGGETIIKHWKPFAVKVWQTVYHYSIHFFFGPLHPYLDKEKYMIFDDSFETIHSYARQMEEHLDLPKHCNHLWSEIDETPEFLKQTAAQTPGGNYWLFSDGTTFGDFEYQSFGQ